LLAFQVDKGKLVSVAKAQPRLVTGACPSDGSWNEESKRSFTGVLIYGGLDLSDSVTLNDM